MFNLTPMVKNLLIVNLVVFFLESILKMDFAVTFGLRYILADSFVPYQFITYMFVHGGFMHLFGNMFALIIFGNMLERFWGPKRFLFFYMVTGIGAGLLYATIDYIETSAVSNDAMAYLADPDPEAFNLFVVQHASQYYESLISFIDAYVENPNNPEYISQSRVFVQDLMGRIENVPMVGASGAVFGILMAFGMLFPNTQLFLLFPPIPIKAKYLVFFYGAYELYSELNRSQGDNVAHLAHLGGMLIAFIVIKYWQKNSSKFY